MTIDQLKAQLEKTIQQQKAAAQRVKDAEAEFYRCDGVIQLLQHQIAADEKALAEKPPATVHDFPAAVPGEEARDVAAQVGG